MNKKTKKYLIYVGAGLAAFAVIGMTAALAANKDDGKDLNPLVSFEVGAIEADGKFDSDAKTNIVSSLVKIDGLKIDIDTGSKLSYEVHYFNADEEYISSTQSMNMDYDAATVSNIPDLAMYVRVEFTHKDDDDITYFERLAYLQDVTVTVKK